MSEAWLTMAVFTLSMVYSVLYQGHWTEVRNYIDIVDKMNWDLFGIYTIILWTLSLVVIPAIVYLISYAGVKFSKVHRSVKEIFLTSTGALMPLGFTLWIAFVIPMLFVNITFIRQSASDPFGWGWDFFGTANIAWHQFVPRLVPWLQSGLVLTGLWFSLRNLKKSFETGKLNPPQLFKLTLPMCLFLSAIAVTMIFFYTN